MAQSAHGTISANAQDERWRFHVVGTPYATNDAAHPSGCDGDSRTS